MDRVLSAWIYLLSWLSGFTGRQERWEPGKKLKILLVGYNGARNTGSDVRVAAIARQVKALFGADKVQLTVMTLDAKTLEGSLDALKKLGLRGHAGTDAAWSYDGAISAAEAEALLRRQGWDGVKPLLGLAVINPFCWPVRASLAKWLRGKLTGELEGQYDKWYFYSDSPERREAYEDYIRAVAAAANAFLREKDAFPVLIGMERLDEKPCRALAAKLDGPAAVFLSGDCGAEIMTGVLRRLDLLVTSRYHASVLSMEGGCPIVAISMDERLDGILRELGLGERWLLHTGDTALGEKLAPAMESAYAERDAVRARIWAALPGYHEKLDAMGRFMKQYIQDALQMK